jgi:hypothetical protein
MTTTLMIKDLLYEELVLLQNIMWYVDNHTDFTVELDPTNRQIFNDLYEKVIQS